ncbi:hypothetical protein GCM10009535_34020 [Streptomyces thermocarboxydovorans]|uniref:GP-PDE domain-containing protein n=1 Tax=Streptomyces thermocarboxydovorans TaxID=59298 RepID=A0ABP3SML4_9ACTN
MRPPEAEALRLRPSSGPAVSAHQGGSERTAPATREAYEDAVAAGADYAELDVRRTADGVFVVHHDARVCGDGPPLSTLTHAELCARAGRPVPVVEEILQLIAGRLLAHLDLKETGHERELIDRAVALLGPDGFVATTLEDRSVAAITAAFPGVRTGLSLGRDRRDVPRGRLLATRLGRAAAHAPGARLRRRRDRRAPPAARAGVLREAARHGLFTMVWTVNDDPLMRTFLADPRVDVLITDRPRRALQLRAHTRTPTG